MNGCDDEPMRTDCESSQLHATGLNRIVLITQQDFMTEGAWKTIYEREARLRTRFTFGWQTATNLSDARMHRPYWKT
ncbi:hypothetical protein [Sphingomonas immobilis]|uniref:Uncharacterized protein n=1 Tax=Sphingomonas immobilis TaxID=3063997 RepID=A0ABT8ZXN7_9SPHN|nr:hypothetical protein [Sphingomonas sp. CA1-15]MDO7841775.1 hypothetical protein [Sphingomonas sp. CA1-15]